MEEKDEFLELAKRRYSVRSFTTEPVKKEDLDKILAAGYYAPTACNIQPQKILVVNNEEGREKLKKCTRCHFDAPMALLVGYDQAACWKRKYDGKASGEIDASIVATHMMLEAEEIGVGVTWVMVFDPKAIKEEFKVPEGIEITAILVMGYPSKEAKPYPGHSEFRAMEDMVFYNQF